MLAEARPSRPLGRLNVRSSLVIAVAVLSMGSGLLAGVPGAPATAAPPVAHFAPSAISAPGLQSGQALQQSPYTTMPGTGLSSFPNATGTAPAPANDPIAFTIGFTLQNESLLEEILTEQQVPGSPMYHHWLTPQQEAAYFGPNPVVVQNTINYFTSLGFRVGTRGPISVSFTGGVGEANAAFHTQIVNVTLSPAVEAATYGTPLSLPTAIAPGISTVNGLSSYAIAHPEHFVDPANAGDVVAPAPFAPSSLATDLSSALTAETSVNISQAFNFTNHAFMWLHYYSQSRATFRSTQFISPGSLDYLYNATSLLNAGYNGNSTGTPIRIAIVMAGGINPDDIKGYGQLVFNNPMAVYGRLTPYPIDGSFTTNGTQTYTDDGSGEMALDIEYSATMALGAHIEAVYGPCLCTNVLDDDYAFIDGMSSTTFPNIVSNSWGGDEDTFGGNLYGPNWQNALTMHHYFMLIDARGATILASSGDGGGFDTGTGILAGSFPATDPYVLSVNGLLTSEADSSGSQFPAVDSLGLANLTICEATTTCLFYDYPVHVDSATQLHQQAFWYEPIRNTTLTSAPPEASGGFGESYFYNQTWFEHGIGVPDVGRALGSGVAAEADFNMTIFFDGSFEWFYGGTSFACPTTAGMWGLIDDYLGAHGQSTFQGDGNVPVFRVGNAWLNGNLSLKPFYDVSTGNGTSYWGNYGVDQQYSWPPGQKFPYAPGGWTTYGNTTPGWDFPTGWGSMNVYNFAHDLATLESMPGTFSTLNGAGTAFDAGAWAYMTLNSTYTIHMNATTAFAASNPTVTVKFIGEDGSVGTLTPTLSYTPTPSNGYNFQLDTSQTPFNGPGLILFEAGNTSTPSAGFMYTWISYPVPVGTLNVTVVAPGEPSGMVGGYAQFNPWPAGYDAPVVVAPSCCTPYPNTFTVRVTLDGHAVYNAVVTATIPDTSVVAWQGSKAQGATDGNGRTESYLTTNIQSQTYTNLTGYALVYTWNVIDPTVYTVSASYGPNSAQTTYNILPGPNVGTTDSYGGTYSQLNTIGFILKQLRQPVNNATLNLWAPNSLNMSEYYDLVYGWAGEIIPVHVNDYQGNPLSGLKVWFGNMDLGGENRFYHYEPSFGVVGVTNTSGTTSYTDVNGNAQLYIPQNESLDFYTYQNGTPFSGFGYLAANVPGASNRTFSYTEQCQPQLPNPKTTITCQYNDTYERNYTSVPMIVLPDPVRAWTQTTSRVQRDFFGEGAKINVGVQVSLPTNDPWITGIGYNWPAGTEHVTQVTAYVDGGYAASLSPDVPPNWQLFNTSVNLTQTYAAGVHTLLVVVNDSVGHTFTSKHTFIIGSIAVTDLGVQNTYTPVPFNLTWKLDIPANQINNHTFNQSLDIRYVTAGCGGTRSPCPDVVNYSEPIHNQVADYYQLLNLTLLNLEHFYSGSTQLPPGQYQLLIWLNANHSGSVVAQINTFLVFDPVIGYLNGPGANATVPLGNVTISYSYSGDYIEGANLSVYASSDLTTPIFNVIAFVPGAGGELRGGAVGWTAVKEGAYQIRLTLQTPFAPYNTTAYQVNETVYVQATSGIVYQNASTSASPIGHMNPAETATILALVAAILGLLVGLWVAPGLRGGGAVVSAKPGPKPWEEGQPAGKQAAPIVCPVCKDEFSTEFALHEHQKIVHGIEA